MLPFATKFLASAATLIIVATIGDQDPSITISNGGNTATKNATTGAAYAFGSSGKVSGKWRFQATCTNATGDLSVGLVGALYLRPGFLGQDTNGIALNAVSTNGVLYNGTTQYGNSANFAVGSVIDVYVDLDLATPRAWFSFNGSVINGNPAAGTGGTAINLMNKAVYPTLYLGGANSSFTFNFGDTAFTYTGVAGFNAWSAVAPPVSMAQFRSFAMLIRSSGQYQAWAETELMVSSGGANMLAGATASGSVPYYNNDATYSYAKSIDADTTSEVILTTNSNSAWIAYELAANTTRNAAFMAIRGRDGGAANAAQAPTLLDLWVSDGTVTTGNWYKVRLGIALSAFAATTPGERKEFAL